MDLITEFIAQIVFWHWGVLVLTLAASLVCRCVFLSTAVVAVAAALFANPVLAPGARHSASNRRRRSGTHRVTFVVKRARPVPPNV
jgi:hypothetical protein